MISLAASVRNRLRYIVSYLRERSRGLDFTLPDRMYDRRRHDGAMYYATAPEVLADLFACVDSARYDRFLDVGCGKGFVLKAAAEQGFRAVGGIEYDEKLAAICRRNMARLGLDGRVRVIRGNAADFRGYGGYNCFYFFNPFRPEIMAAVVDAICRQCRGRDVLLIYYHPRYTEAIEEAGCFRLMRVLRDPARDYDVFIYQGAIPA